MRLLYREGITETVEVYKKLSVPIEDYSIHPYLLALKEERPLGVRKLILSNIEKCNNKVVKSFVVQHGEVFILPLLDLVAIRGFELRAVRTKDFRFIGDGQDAFYGFNYFKGFKFGQVAFIVEGVKDAKALQQEYPFVIATLGVTVGQDTVNLLNKITDKWVFINDNDYWGRKSLKRMKYLGIKAISVPFKKDLGSVFEGDNEVEGYIKGLIRSYV